MILIGQRNNLGWSTHQEIGKVGPRDKDGAFWGWAGMIGWAFEMVVGNWMAVGKWRSRREISPGVLELCILA
jgi:hypothetical protein